MNTGGGSVFHRQRWVMFRATLTADDQHLPFSPLILGEWTATRGGAIYAIEREDLSVP